MIITKGIAKLNCVANYVFWTKFKTITKKIKHTKYRTSKIIINGKDVQRKKCCKQCGQVKFMGTMIKMARTKTHRTSQNTEYTKTQQTLRNTYFCVFRIGLFFIFNFQLLKEILQNMLNYRLGTVNKTLGFKPVFRCSKPRIFSTFPGEEK